MKKGAVDNSRLFVVLTRWYNKSCLAIVKLTNLTNTSFTSLSMQIRQNRCSGNIYLKAFLYLDISGVFVDLCYC